MVVDAIKMIIIVFLIFESWSVVFIKKSKSTIQSFNIMAMMYMCFGGGGGGKSISSDSISFFYCFDSSSSLRKELDGFD